MSYNTKGRPRGRPTKEWSEYVPKGIDPRHQYDDDYYQVKAMDSDRQRPTEDKADHEFNKKPSKPAAGQKSSKRGNNDWTKKEDRNVDSMEYTAKHSGKTERQNEAPKRSDRDEGLMSYQKKGKKLGNGRELEEGNIGGTEDHERKTYQWRECVVCLLKCSPTSTVWNCTECRITCHLKCIRDWICKQNNIERYDPKIVDRSKSYSWTCPHCQTPSKGSIPSYYCFCGKTKNPKPDVFLEPHSCGLECGKKKGGNCAHPCTELCHSGFCPPCEIVIPQVPCFCGKQTKDRVCGEFNKRGCGSACNKILNCKMHRCEKLCHEGDCPPCLIMVESSCHCGKLTDSRRCGEEFSCREICNRQLDCEVHRCGQICHSG